MDFGRAFTYVFEDRDWLKKVGIAALILIIPLIGGITVLGWALDISRRVIHRDPVLLPDWSNFADHLVRGLKAFVIGLVYSIPIFLLSVCANLPTMFAGNADENTQAAISILGACFGCLVFIASLVIYFFLIAALGNFAATDDLGAAFRFGDIMAQVRRAPSAYLLALLGYILVGIIVPIGLIACIIGVFFTAAYANAVMGHLVGQAYLASGGNAGAPAMSGAETF